MVPMMMMIRQQSADYPKHHKGLHYPNKIQNPHLQLNIANPISHCRAYVVEENKTKDELGLKIVE